MPMCLCQRKGWKNPSISQIEMETLDGPGQLSCSFGLAEKVMMPFAVFHPNLIVGGPTVQCLGCGLLSMDGIEG